MDLVVKRGASRPVGVAACVLFAACGITDPLSPLVYELVSFEGQPVPAELNEAVTIVEGELTLELDGTCLRTQSLRLTAEDGSTRDSHAGWPCRWSSVGDTMTFVWELPVELPNGMAVRRATASGESRELSLVLDTGIRCVRAPCPTRFTEVYRQVSGPS